jgi:hypothetical protein
LALGASDYKSRGGQNRFGVSYFSLTASITDCPRIDSKPSARFMMCDSGLCPHNYLVNGPNSGDALAAIVKLNLTEFAMIESSAELLL